MGNALDCAPYGEIATMAIGGSKPKVGERSRMLSTSRNDPISMALRQLHDHVLAEPIPDDFLDILSKMDKKMENGGKH